MAAETGTAETWLEKNLGAELLGQNGVKVKTSDVAKKQLVSFYFSAHWCPPCRGFTPKLADAYKKIVNEDKKEWDIIFLSSDKNQSAFDDYFKEMPWKAVAYANRDVKDQMSRKFKVSGIPALIMLDPKTGEIMNKDGRSAISGDLTGEKYPWTNKPKKCADIIKQMTAITPDDGEITGEQLMKDNDYLMIYFSAHWCPPCRGFTPELVKWFNKYAADKKVQCIFNSWDRSEDQFNEYRKEMPWVARKYDDKDTRKWLDDLYEVQGIPSLVVVNAKTGTLVTKDARGSVQAEPEGFPWEKKPVDVLGPKRIDALNSTACLIAWVPEAKKDDVTKAMMPAATKIAEKMKSTGEWPDIMPIEFIVDDMTHALSSRVTGLIKRDDKKEILSCMILGRKELINCAEVTKADDITEDVVTAFVKKIQDKSYDQANVRKLEL